MAEKALDLKSLCREYYRKSTLLAIGLLAVLEVA